MIRSGVFLLKLLFAMVPSDPPESFAESNHTITSNWINVSSVSDESNSLVNSTSQPLTSLIIKRSLVNALPVANLSLLHARASSSFPSSSVSPSRVTAGALIDHDVPVNNLSLVLSQSVSSTLASLASSASSLFNSSLILNSWSNEIVLTNSSFAAHSASSLLDHSLANSSSVFSLLNSTTSSVDESIFNSTSNATSTSPYTPYDSLTWYEYELFASTNVSTQANIV